MSYIRHEFAPRMRSRSPPPYDPYARGLSPPRYSNERSRPLSPLYPAYGSPVRQRSISPSLRAYAGHREERPRYSPDRLRESYYDRHSPPRYPPSPPRRRELSPYYADEIKLKRSPLTSFYADRRSPPRAYSRDRSPLHRATDYRGERDYSPARYGSPPPLLMDVDTRVSKGKPFNKEFKSDLMAEVKELIDDERGCLEMSKRNAAGYYPTVFFHISSLYVADPEDPRTCIKYYGPHMGSLAKFMPLGKRVCFDGIRMKKDCIMEWVALKVWPHGASRPSGHGDEEMQSDNVKDFLSSIDRRRLVFATLATTSGSRMAKVSARVSKIVSDEFGIVDVIGVHKKQKLKCMFHYDSIWLENGDRAVDNFGGNRNVRDFVTVGMEVNVRARSIIKHKGQDIMPSKLELQAVVVYLRSGPIPHTAPRTTRLRGSPGSIGYSRYFTPYFLNRYMFDILNDQLSDYINLVREVDPLVEKSYLNSSVDINYILQHQSLQSSSSQEFENEMSISSRIKKDLLNVKGIIKIIFDDLMGGIIETCDKTKQCFFFRDQVRLRSLENFDEVCLVGRMMRFNATCIDLSQPVPYLASCVWNEDNFPTQRHDNDFVDAQIERYERANNDFDNILCPQSAKWSSGKLYKILDDNFGLIKWKSNDSFVLFDTCDLWLENGVTADRAGKSIKDSLRLEQDLKFHAVLMDKEAKIPYLASAVWNPDDKKFFKIPEPVEKEDIRMKKISIFNVVLKSVGESIKAKKKGDGETIIGRVKTIFRSKGIAIGGLVHDDSGRDAFFDIDDSFQNYPVGSDTRYFIKFVRGLEIKFVAICLCPADVAMEDGDCRYNDKIEENNERVDAAVSRWKKYGSEKLLKSESSIVDVDAGTSDLSPFEDAAASATLVCMINEKSGVLRNDFDRDRLCYFELNDLNLAFGNEALTLKDIVAVLANDIPGVRVRYQATKPIKEEDRPHEIQYIANCKGVQIMVSSTALSFLKLLEPTKSFEPDLGESKMERWRAANKLFSKSDTISVRKILKGDHPNIVLPLSESDTLPTILFQSRGRIRQILNENFGLAQDVRTGAYCLFDTFDLYIYSKTSASDTGKTISDVVKVGDEVVFNATLVRASKKVPYLITGVWRHDCREDMPNIDPVGLGAIQKDKISVYETVSDSCESVLRSLSDKKEAPDTDTRTVIEMKKYIKRAYESESYRKYIAACPKNLRGRRDPSTPEADFCRDDPDGLIKWREDINDWLSDKLRRGELDVYDDSDRGHLNDNDTTGQLYTADSGEYGVLRLMNGKKALLHRRRVWLTTSPLSEDGKLQLLLWRERFRTVCVNARKLPESIRMSTGVDYQVIYSHSAAVMPRIDGKFQYPSKMKRWIEILEDETVLDAELKEFIRFTAESRRH